MLQKDMHANRKIIIMIKQMALFINTFVLSKISPLIQNNFFFDVLHYLILVWNKTARYILLQDLNDINSFFQNII